MSEHEELVLFVCCLFFPFVVLSEIYKNTFEMISHSIYYGEKSVLRGPSWAFWKSILAQESVLRFPAFHLMKVDEKCFQSH